MTADLLDQRRSDLDALLVAAGIPQAITHTDLIAAVGSDLVRSGRRQSMHRHAYALGSLQSAIANHRRYPNLAPPDSLDRALAESYVITLDDDTFNAVAAHAADDGNNDGEPI